MAKPDVYLLRFTYGLGLQHPCQLGGLKYAGGNYGSHAKYWKLLFGDRPFPPHQSRCACGHDITENCYIMDETGKLYVVGNHCIKRYLPKANAGRTCEICKAPHRNIKNNLCVKCRLVKH